MYNAPNFVKVSVKTKDIFSSYYVKCEGDYDYHYLYSGDTGCRKDDEAGNLVYGVEDTYQCYSLLDE